MMKKNRTRKNREAGPRRKLTPKTVVAVCIVALLAFMFGPQVKTIWEMKQEIKTLQAKKAALEKRKQELTEMERKLRTDQMVEKLAREELGMIKPGEKVLVKVVPEPGPGQPY